MTGIGECPRQGYLLDDRLLSIDTELPPLNIGPITRRTLALFAGGSGDHQPIHIDIDAARVRGREDVIAHGMLTMAYLGRLLSDWVPQERVKSFRTRFTGVTPVLADPTCRGRVSAIEGNCATVQLSVTLADGTISAIGEAVIELT